MSVHPKPTPPTLNAVQRWHRALETCEGLRLAWRETPARMGLYACPEPSDFPKLFQAAADDWQAIRDPIERALFCGLAVLLIHPLINGNGRLSRLIWREQLSSEGVDPAAIDAALHRAFSFERNRWIASVAQARSGNPTAVYAQLRQEF